MFDVLSSPDIALLKAFIRASSMGGAALASWTNAGEPNRMARAKAAVRVFMISLHAESDLHGRRVTSHERCEPSEVCQISANFTRDAAVQAALYYWTSGKIS